jgi:hypothetical protein
MRFCSAILAIGWSISMVAPTQLMSDEPIDFN